MDQDGNMCRCLCHVIFLGKEPEWKCYCSCNGKINIDHYKKTPYKCPVCDGTRFCYGKETMKRYECESCDGKGIVWG